MKKVKLERRFISGVRYEKLAVRKMEFTIICKDHSLHNSIFYQETITKRISEFEFGKHESIYYFPNETDEFNTIDGLLNSKYLKI